MPDDVWHVVPVGDVVRHAAEPDCVCGPALDEVTGLIWVHHSLDGREFDE